MSKETIVKCDQCGCVIKDMHMGMEVTPLEGALRLGDWREEDWQFCGITCLNNYIMDNWPHQETIEMSHAITAGKVVLNAFRQGVLPMKNAQWLIWLIASTMNITPLLERYPEWNPKYTIQGTVTEPALNAKEYNEDLHKAFLKTDSRGA